MIWLLQNTTKYFQLLPYKKPGVGVSPPRFVSSILITTNFYELLRITTITTITTITFLVNYYVITTKLLRNYYVITT